MSFMFPSWILLRRILSQVNKFHPRHQLRLMVNKNGRWRRYWMLVSAIDILNTSSSGLDMIILNGWQPAISMDFVLLMTSTGSTPRNLDHYQKTLKSPYYRSSGSVLGPLFKFQVFHTKAKSASLRLKSISNFSQISSCKSSHA